MEDIAKVMNASLTSSGECGETTVMVKNLKKRRSIRTTKSKSHLRGSDLRQISTDEMMRWVRKARRLPAVRKDLVERIRREIADGVYETPEKLALAIERLIQEEFE
ncbi:MAG: hypothetical protein J7L99_06795 [Planctomycetes bacterium]|nr:hypothetical protein [Planctomycetota bacterium]